MDEGKVIIGKGFRRCSYCSQTCGGWEHLDEYTGDRRYIQCWRSIC